MIHPTVTVSIPFHGPTEYLPMAVRSALDQVDVAVRVVVVNDGAGEGALQCLDGIDDPRLVRFSLPENRGRYFADAVVQKATTDPYLLIQDADDWSESDRTCKLLQAIVERSAGVAVSGFVEHRGANTKRRPKRSGAGIGPAFRHRLDHHALFDCGTLRNLGGTYAGFRVGFDTLLMNIYLMMDQVAPVDECLYHRRVHPQALTKNRKTGIGSRYRNQEKARLRALYVQLLEEHRLLTESEISTAQFQERTASILRAQVEPADLEAIDGYSKELGAVLEEMPEPTCNSQADTATPSAPVDKQSWSGWAIKPPLIEQLSEVLEQRRPSSILELGSGRSTIALGRYAQRHGAHVTSLEHAQRWLGDTAERLEREGVRDSVDLRHAELTIRPHKDGIERYWYDAELERTYDLVFIDGPPKKYGRCAALFELEGKLADDCLIMLHDGRRKHERRCVSIWKEHFGVTARLDTSTDARGVWLLGNSSGSDPYDVIDFDDVGIGILTGQRPGLLSKTLDALETASPDIVAKLPVFALLNGTDDESLGVLLSKPWIDDIRYRRGSVLPIGAATSELMAHLCRIPGLDYIFHLEDDWQSTTPGNSWLVHARELLCRADGPVQIRMRLASARVKTRHMVTRRPIVWKDHSNHRWSDSAHFTFNPNLISVPTARQIYPCTSERDAQKAFVRIGGATAQLVPGTFGHIGGANSLRKRRGRPMVAQACV